MKINIRYYAILKEQADKIQESIEFEGNTPRELWKKLVGQYGFNIDTEQLKVAINDQYVSFDTVIKESDLVVFIPPVAGG